MGTSNHRFENGGFLLDQHYILSLFVQTFVNNYQYSAPGVQQSFEKNIIEIKNNHLKSIASAATNPSAITSFDENSDPLCINNSFEAVNFEPEPIFEKTIN